MNPVANLVARLEAASTAYYDGHPIMGDDEFDAILMELRRVDPTNAFLGKIGAPGASGWPKVQLSLEMGSLDKSVSDADFDKWWTTLPANEEKALTHKLDGMSIELIYEGGVLLRAATRGDGVTGEDITRNVRAMQGVPLTIPFGGTAEARGEVIVTKSDFAKFFQGESNTRSTACGTSKRQSNWEKCRHLTVVCYNLRLSDNSVSTRKEQIDTMVSWGFKCTPVVVTKLAADVKAMRLDYINGLRAALDYDIDGLVIELNRTAAFEAVGKSGMNPLGATAFKFPHENIPAVIDDITWQVGKSGRVTPVANFATVKLVGADVNNASLHNISQIGRMAQKVGKSFLGRGDLILVSRRNDVIPAVEGLLVPNDAGHTFSVPTACPCCKTPLVMDGEYLTCFSNDCPAQEVGSLRRWVEKIGVLHLGNTALNAMYEAGLVSSIPDLYTVDQAAVSALVVDGRRIGGTVERGFASLHSNKELTLDTIVGSLGIPGVGRSVVKFIFDAGYDTIAKMAAATVGELTSIPNIGPERAQAFRDGFDSRRNLIVTLLAVGVKIVEPVKAAVTGNALAGTSVCFTGVRDDAMEAKIIANGGTIASGVSKNLGILVAKEPKSTSGKSQKARDLGIRVLSLTEMAAFLAAL